MPKREFSLALAAILAPELDRLVAVGPLVVAALLPVLHVGLVAPAVPPGDVLHMLAPPVRMVHLGGARIRSKHLRELVYVQPTRTLQFEIIVMGYFCAECIMA